MRDERGEKQESWLEDSETQANFILSSKYITRVAWWVICISLDRCRPVSCP